jgi:hypothetical protein
MADVPVGADAPVVDVTPPAADAVTAPDAPPVQEPAAEVVQPPKTYSEDEMRKVVSDRLKKESRRLERAVRAELERDAALKELETLKAPKTPQAPKEGKPKPSDFNDPADYVEALTEWKIEQREKGLQSKKEAETGDRDRREATAYLEERFTEAEEKFPDLRARLEADDVLLTDAMLGFVLHHEHGFAVGDYLAGHSAESRRIGKLPLALQPIALKEVADKLKAPPKPTQTPPPIKPLDGNAGAKRDWQDLSTAEHVEKWLKRKR